MRIDGNQLTLHLPEDSETREMIALYEEWPELSPRLDRLLLAGKEPLLSSEIWEIFDFFGDLGGSGKIRIEVESGFDVPAEVFDRFIMKTHYVGDLHLIVRPRNDLNAQEWGEKLRYLILHGHMRSMTVEGDLTPSQREVIGNLARESRPDFLRIRDQ